MDKSTASPTIRLSPHATPGYTHAAGLTQESATKASQLLELNHEMYHARWKSTFHNHLTHQLLALWALGATPEEMQDQWDINTPYQTLIEETRAAVTVGLDLSDPMSFQASLGKNECYADFLAFFENEVDSKGIPAVVREYVLGGDERANDILGRMFSDLVHPMIHLGCGIEFDQPSLVAEALAGACIHADWPNTFLLPTEDYVQSNKDVPSNPFLQVLESLRQDPQITSGVKSTDPFNKVPDGLLTRVTAAQLMTHLGQFQIKPEPEDIQRGMEDMMLTCAYMMGAAQQPGKRETIDFVLLHCVTLAVFFPPMMAQGWMADHERSRLLEAAGRVQAVMYAGCGCPPLYPERIIDYSPWRPNDGWPELFQRSIVYRDEGHAVKLIRSLFSLESISDARIRLPIPKKDFVKIAHMTMDSIERASKTDGNRVPAQVEETILEDLGREGHMVTDNMKRWVFYGGLDKAWQYVPDLERPVA